jgi:hypothetical protein
MSRHPGPAGPAPSRSGPKTEQEAHVIVEQIHYDGDWTAIIERRLLDPDKPQGQRYLRMEHVATIHTNGSQ